MTTGMDLTTEQCAAIHWAAHAAGMKAGMDAIPTMMQMGDDVFPMHGYSYIYVAKYRTPFAKWLRDNREAEHDAGRAATMISADGDGMFFSHHDRSAAYAHAYVQVLQKHGVRSWSESRID